MNNEASEIKLEKEEFKNWLLEKDKDDCAGIRTSARCCPIANWLRKANESTEVEVCRVEISINDDTFITPNWAVYFIGEVEKKYKQSTFCGVEEALEILHRFDSFSKQD